MQSPQSSTCDYFGTCQWRSTFILILVLKMLEKRSNMI